MSAAPGTLTPLDVTRRRATHRPADQGRAPAVVLRLVSIASVFALWWLLTELGIWSRLILPRPSDVWHAFIQSVTTEGRRRGLYNFFLWEHLRASFWRIANGLFWAIVVGPPLGLLLAGSRWIRMIVEPWISFLRSLPPLAYFSLLIIWFGIKDTSKIWLLFIAAFPPIVLATINGISRIPREQIDAARGLGATRLQALRIVMVPAAVPDIITGIRVACGFAWTTIVAAETSNGLPGIGGLAWATKKETRTDIAIMCVIVIGITAVLLDQLIQLSERVLVPWRHRPSGRPALIRIHHNRKT